MNIASSVSAIQIVVEFGRDLFGLVVAGGGVAAWNDLMGSLFERELLSPCWPASVRPPPLVVMVDLSRENLSHKRLDGINLAFAWVQEADFSGSSLKGARLGCCPGSCFRDCRLDGAGLGGDISGCAFQGASLHGVQMDGACYDPASPPTDLPPDLLARCRLDRGAAPPRGPRETHVRCCATIHLAPME